MSTRRLRFYMTQESPIRSLLDEAERLHGLGVIWARIVPPEIVKLSRVGFLHQGELTVFVSQNTAAAKLRQMQNSLIYRLQKEGLNVTALKIRISMEGVRYAPPRADRKIPQEGLSGLRALAESMAPCPLRASIERLLLNHEKED